MKYLHPRHGLLKSVVTAAFSRRYALLAVSCSLLPVSTAAQDLTLFPGLNPSAEVETPMVSFQVTPRSALGEIDSTISAQRSQEALTFQGNVVQDALNFNLGMQVAPLEGLSLRADVWTQQLRELPQANASASLAMPGLYIQDSNINEFNLDTPLLGSDFRADGFDLGASYVWETDRFGEFTLSTTTSYVDRFENRGGLLDLVNSELVVDPERLVSPELQSSLMLSWKFGNHTASAITNYFNSFKDISELDLDEVNELVDSMTTIDLQYGYSVERGNKDRAIISFGIRNIFNEDSAQILNATTRIIDQNGRVAYGSIKYQF